MTRMTVLLAMAIAVALPGIAYAHCVPEKQQDPTCLYHGSLDSFENAGEVVLGEVVQATPEYKSIGKKKIKRGTGEYWILMEKASSRALRAVESFAGDSDYDLIVASGYLGSVDPAIPAEDVTKQVIESMLEDE